MESLLSYRRVKKVNEAVRSDRNSACYLLCERKSGAVIRASTKRKASHLVTIPWPPVLSRAYLFICLL